MPIPQLTYKSTQGWRRNKKKYFISRTSGAKKNKGSFSQKRKKLPFFKAKTIVTLIIVLILFGGISGLVLIAWFSRGLPPPGQLIEREIAQCTKIYDRAGKTILYEIHGDEKRTSVTLDEIPSFLKQATIAIEDKGFYKHGGISLWGIFRGVVWQKIRGKPIQGGSTLTQQFIKNAILTSERTIKRKIKEWVLAYKIEKKYSKNEILQMYLNEIPYGSTAYGVEAASQRYFGKNIKEINLPEAAILAALPQAPSRYSPYGSNKNLLIARQHYVLDLMYEQGYISEAKVEAAKQYKLEFKKPVENIIAPHFVMYVKEVLAEKYSEKMIEQGGLKIITTLDLYKQKIAEEVIAKHTDGNEKEYEATNAALVSLDPKTGQILAMVGSRDYFNEEIDGQVNVTTSARQPGSSLKPFVYITSFMKGYTPDTVLYDVVTNFSHDESEPYEPHNYDLEEHGPVTMKKALAGSLNIPAVKTIYLAGINNVLDLAEELGYTTLTDRSRFGLSLVLGGGEVKLLEHTNAYGALAREGIIHQPVAILKVEDKDGNTVEEFKLKEKRVLDPKIARQINNILSDNEARAYAFGELNWLTLGSRPVAAKTGTTNDYRDAWTLGYTPSLVAGVWVGNSDNAPMKRGAAGGTVAAPIWHDYMKRVLGNTPIEQFKEPEVVETGNPILDGETTGGSMVKIDRASGLLATDHTPASFIEEKLFREDHCILYYIKKDDPRGEAPEDPARDPQFELWESRVEKWATERGYATSSPPTKYDNLHLPENRPVFDIISPTNNQTIMESLFTASIKATAPRGIHRAEYYINNNILTINSHYPFNLVKQINFLNNGFHNLTVRVCDNIDNCSEKKVEFNLILDQSLEGRDFSISWIEPANGLAVNNIDFPLQLRLKVDNPQQIAKINVFSVLGDQKAQFIKKVAPIETNLTSTTWPEVPLSGIYKVYAEAVGWREKIEKTKEIIITVTNINQ